MQFICFRDCSSYMDLDLINWTSNLQIFFITDYDIATYCMTIKKTSMAFTYEAPENLIEIVKSLIFKINTFSIKYIKTCVDL